MFFGVPALIVVGLTWTLTGVVMSDAPRRKVDPAIVLLLSNGFSLIVCLGIMCFAGIAMVSWKVWLLAGGCYFCSSALNFLMLQVMSYAMQRGPNGIIWSIIQSALIFPFLTGVIFFNSAFTLWRGVGLVVVVSSILLLGSGRDNRQKSGGWKLPTMAAFLMAGIVLSMNTIPSYYPELQKLDSIGRVLCSVSGGLLAGGMYNFSRYRSCSAAQWLGFLKNPLIWKYVLMLKSFGLIASYLLLYPGLDAMAKAGAGCISYPLIVGSCIVGFNLYSLVRLREKSSLVQIAGIASCMAGLLLLMI